MKYKVGDIVEVTEVLKAWYLYPLRHKILKRPWKVVEVFMGGSCMVDVGVGKLHLMEHRLKPYVEVGKQLEFNFMQ